MTILGIGISELTPAQITKVLVDFLQDKKQHMVVTPNPEMVVAATKDEYFKEVLNEADISICDGKGLELVSRGTCHRYAGVDVMEDLCAIAEKEGKSIFLLGTGKKDVLEKAKQQLLQEFPLLRIVGMHEGIPIHEGFVDGNETRKELLLSTDDNDSMINTIIDAAPHILFVAFGHSKQEKWIYEYLSQLPSVHIAMGVGGAIDFIAKTSKRAPGWMRRCGLEWLWRLLREPQRMLRIWRAVVVFPFLYFTTPKD